VLIAVAYAFLQDERRRQRRGTPLTFPAIRAIVQEIFPRCCWPSSPTSSRAFKNSSKSTYESDKVVLPVSGVERWNRAWDRTGLIRIR
jgi:hypothetical protein